MAKLDKLITFAYLKEECDLPQNLPDSEFEHKVYRAQEMLRMLMGDAFYQDFVTAYKAGPFSAVYEALYNPYMKQFIAWQANEFWTIKANFKVNRAGFRVHSEDNSVVASDEQMGPIIKDAKQQAYYYKRLFVGFLNTHATDYPLYSQGCDAGSKTGNSMHISAVKNKHRECHHGRGRRCCG